MPASAAAAWINRETRRGEHVLPWPFPWRFRIFPLQRVWQIDTAETCFQIFFMLCFYLLQMPLQTRRAMDRQHRESVFSAFAVANEDVCIGEVHVLYSQTYALH